MSFTLQITFRGMCFYVPDPGEKRMHVLMPATGDHGHGMEPHHALLAFPGRPIESVSLDGRELDLSGLRTEGEALNLPPGVADLWVNAGLKIDPVQLGPTPRASVAARLRLPGGSTAKQGPSAGWKFRDDGPVEILTNEVTLTWQVPATSLELQTRPLAGGKPDAPLSLEPEEGMIRLVVSYLPEREPPNPRVGDPAPHFECHYALFEPTVTGPSPRLHSYIKGGDLGGGSPYTCLTAGGPPGP